MTNSAKTPKLTIKDAIDIRKLIKEGSKMTDIAAQYNVSYIIVDLIRQDKIWKSDEISVKAIMPKITETDVFYIKELLKLKKYTYEQLAMLYGISPDIISVIHDTI